MDEGCSKAVREVFVNLYNKGLIYKGHRIINWCPHCATALSDAEVEYEDPAGQALAHPLSAGGRLGRSGRCDHPSGDHAWAIPALLSTRTTSATSTSSARPAFSRSWTARFRSFGDEYVDMEFGTGCVKVTPCHDPNDFEVGQRHNLEQILVFNEDATVNANGGKYEGMDRYECRKAIVADLEEGG